ncbi:MAG: hypothetical protein P1U70_09680 [Saprospiraceae bacterium]|nr:hypothetical protein [Saprospiraceae bacterium]
MNTRISLIASFFLVGFFSCKKDFDFDNGVIMPPVESEFYVSGTNIFDEVNSYEFNYQGGELIHPMVEVTYGSASAIGEENGEKYIVSMVGTNPGSYRDRTFKENDPSGGPIGIIGSGLYIKINSDRLASEANRKFTREELAELIQVGKHYGFGSEAGQVEIGFASRDIDEETKALIPWQFPGIQGTSDMPNTESFFNVLEIDEYEDPTDYKYAKGLKVKVRFNVNLRNHFWIHTDLYLRDVEGVFFFEYE